MLVRSKQICQHCLFWSPWVWQGSLLSQSNRCWNYIFSMSVDFRGGKTPNLFTDFIDRHPIRGKPSEYSMLSGGPYNQDRRWLKPWLNLTGLQISSALKNALKLCGFSVLATKVCQRCEGQQGNRWTCYVRMLFLLFYETVCKEPAQVRVTMLTTSTFLSIIYPVDSY